MKFPAIYKLLKPTSETVKMAGFASDYGVILNGRIQTVSPSGGCYLKAANYMSAASVKNAERKAFTAETLKLMHEADEVEFAENEMILYRGDANTSDGRNGANMDYEAIIDDKFNIIGYDDLLGEFDVDLKAKFTGLQGILSGIMTGTVPDASKIDKRTTHFKGLYIDPVLLASFTEVLSWGTATKEGERYVKLDLFHGNKEQDKRDLVSAPIIITPDDPLFKLYDDLAFITPCHILKNS